MASVFDTWINSKPTSTPVPMLGIHTSLNELRQRSEKYFVIEKGAMAADGNQLAVRVQEGANFHLGSDEYLRFLDACVQEFNECSAKLKMIDVKLASCFIFGTVATALHFLPFVNLLSLVGWGATFYYVNERALAYSHYQEALTLLVASCNWSLGEGLEVRKDAGKTEDLIKHQSIRNMMKALYPVLTEAQVRHLIADPIEKHFVTEYLDYIKLLELGYSKSKFFSHPDDEIALSKHRTEFNRCIYGFNKGGMMDFIDALFSAIPDLYNAITHGWQQFKYWIGKCTSPEPQKNEANTNYSAP